MSSTITEIYDNITTIIETAFPNRTRLLDSGNIEDNNDLWLKNGYAVSFGTMAPTETFERVLRRYNRNITITFTESVFGSDKKIEVSTTKEKALLEDQLTLIKQMKSSSLVVVERVEFTGDDGIEPVFSEKGNYIKLSTNFIIDYTEKITD